MSQPLILLDREMPSVVVLSLNRPERRNALSLAMASELAEAIVSVEKEAAIRVLILRGKGLVFCAGLDLREAADLEMAHRSGQAVARLLETLTCSRLISIAAVHGAAMAGGAGLMSACDLAVAAEGVRIGFPEVRRGLEPALILMNLDRQLRDRDLRELLLLGEPVDAQRALSIGLLNRVVPPEELMAEAYRMADGILAGAPRATAHAKQLILGRRAMSVHEEMKRALEQHLEARNTDEAREGISAFLEKRNPRWQ